MDHKYIPKPYQVECINNLFEKICNGNRRLTVLFPTGGGKTYVAAMLVKKICNTYQKAVLIVEHEQIKQQCNDYIESLEIRNGCCQTVNQFLNAKENYDMVVLLEVRPALRLRLEEYFKGDDRTIIVSFGVPGYAKSDREATVDYMWNGLLIETRKPQELRKQQLSRLLVYYTKLGKYQPLVYTTKELVDVRDVFSASKDEKEEVTKQLEEDNQRLSKDMSTITKELQNLSDMGDISEVEDVLKMLSRKIDYQTQLLASVGVTSDLIDKEFNRIEELRKALSAGFYDAENRVVEAIMAQFETAVAESVAKLTEKIITVENKERYEDILKDFLSEKVWNMLANDSRNFLITAKMNYETFIKMEEGESLDYSGVCLLLSKVLDIEMARRLYEKYIEYLQEHHLLSEWPKALRNKKGTSMIKRKDFTLGTVVYVIGCNKYGVIEDEKAFEMFKEFAKKELYVQEISREQCQQKIKNLVECVEKVRVDYRNPAAHRNSLDVVSAKACMDYMIKTYKKLKEILEDMKW